MITLTNRSTRNAKREAREARKRAVDAMKSAAAAIGGLSNTSKLPKKTRAGCNVSTGSSYSLSAYDCRVGSKLAEIPGSVCFKCYARKGFQNFPQNQNLYRERLRLYHEIGPAKWAEYLAAAIEPDSDFRFFDSGDIADYGMLLAIVEVARLRPDVRFWLPSKEYSDVQRLKSSAVEIPSNLCVRLSVPMVNDDIPSYGNRSIVCETESQVPAAAHICPCSRGERQSCDDPAGNCRVCWDSNVEVVCYILH